VGKGHGYLITERVHEASQQGVVHVAIDTPLHLGNDAVHVIQEIVKNHQQAASPRQLVPATPHLKQITFTKSPVTCVALESHDLSKVCRWWWWWKGGRERDGLSFDYCFTPTDTEAYEGLLVTLY
jgi:hypothetical protein